MADVVLAAVCWVEVVAALDESFEFASERSELAELGVDIAEPVGQELCDVAARRSALCAHVEHAEDLVQRQAGALGSSDERDAIDRGLVVGPVAVGLPLGLGEQSASFVEPDRLGRHAGRGGEFADVHEAHRTLDLEP